MSDPEAIQGGDMDVADMLRRLKRVESFMERFSSGGSLDDLQVHVFPGGRPPRPQTDGAVGYDCYARAIVDRNSKPTVEQPLRRTRADFLKTGADWKERVDEDIRDWIIDDPVDPEHRYGIAVPVGERCMVGLGFATAMPMPMFYDVRPRSGMASIGVNLDNAPGTVDPDYRGEAGALITNRSKNRFPITRDTRICQAVFMLAVMPRLVLVESHDNLAPSLRGVGGFGSTGAHHTDEEQVV